MHQGNLQNETPANTLFSASNFKGNNNEIEL